MASMDEIVTCRYCAAQVYVVESRLPITGTEREVLGERSFVMIGGDNWILHRCVIAAEEEPG